MKRHHDQASYRRGFIGSLPFQRVTRDHHDRDGGRDAGMAAAGRHGTGAVAESLHYILKHEAETEKAN